MLHAAQKTCQGPHPATMQQRGVQTPQGPRISQPGTGTTLHNSTEGSVAADVAFWDLRVDHSLRLVRSHARGAMTCLAAHDFAPLLATGSLRQQVRVLTNAGEDVDDITHHESFGSDRLAPVTCVAFHPTKPLLAVGATDSVVSIYSS